MKAKKAQTQNKKDAFVTIRKMLADNQISDFADLFRLLYDEVDDYDEEGTYDYDGLQALASALKTNTSLKEIRLERNLLNTEAEDIFYQGIDDNGSLTKVITDNFHYERTNGIWNTTYSSFTK